MDIYEVLNNLKIKYDEIEHEAVFTVKEAKRIERKLDGQGCKNLFLKYKDKYFVYVLDADKRADLKAVANFLGVSFLKFGSEEDLYKLLGLIKGSVTPLGIINDKECKVEIVIDTELVGKRLMVHPNTNTKTIAIEYDDLIKLIQSQNHKYKIFKEVL